MAEYSLVDILLPIQISVLPGLISLKAMATPFLYLLPVYIQPCLMIWGDVCHVLLEEALYFPVQAVLCMIQLQLLVWRQCGPHG